MGQCTPACAQLVFRELLPTPVRTGVTAVTLVTARQDHYCEMPGVAAARVMLCQLLPESAVPLGQKRGEFCYPALAMPCLLCASASLSAWGCHAPTPLPYLCARVSHHLGGNPFVVCPMKLPAVSAAC